jgi:hypothetical protein
MNSTSLFIALRALRRCVFFSFVAGPAIFLFLSLAMLFVTDSPFEMLVDKGRLLTAGAPPGMVMVCLAESEPVSTPPENPVLVAPKPCLRHPVTEESWVQVYEQSFFRLYKKLAMVSLLLWLLYNLSRHPFPVSRSSIQTLIKKSGYLLHRGKP